MPEVELRALSPELEQSPSEQDFGSESTTGGFSVWVGDNPIAFPFDSLFEAAHGTIPKIAEFADLYDLWLIPHSLSIMRKKGLAEVTSAGIECEYVTGAQTCSIVGLLPTPEFIQYGKLGVKFACNISPLAKLDTLLSEMEGGIEFCGLKANASAGVDVGISFTVSTPYIAAVGLGSRHAAWEFTKRDDPLFGTTIQTWSIVLLSRFQDTLDYKMRYSVTSRTAFIPRRYESDWQEITCQLVRDRSHRQ